jgi:hypothetical protein
MNKKNWVLSLFLSIGMLVILLHTNSQIAKANSPEHNIGTESLTISEPGRYGITGFSNINTVKVDSGIRGLVIIKLNNVDIDVSGTSGKAFSIGTGSEVRLILSGTNTLISGMNCAGLEVPEGAKLNIEAFGEGSLEAAGGLYGAGIGGSNSNKCGILTIKGGEITANGGLYAAGIGSGGCYDYFDGDGGTVIIQGGKVKATGSSGGAGIGGSRNGDGGAVIITGGEVTATSLTSAAGIGGGESGTGGEISICGGTVIATGGNSGAGIGGGYEAAGGLVEISGGLVLASGGNYSAGIGGGGSVYIPNRGDGGLVSISGGKVIAAGGNLGGAGIGGGSRGSGGTVEISGGTVTATGGPGGVGMYGWWFDPGKDIGAGGKATAQGSCIISGGSVKVNDMGPTPSDSQNQVYLTTVSLSGIGEVIDLNYQVKHDGRPVLCSTDSDGRLYLWLPANTGGSATAIFINTRGRVYEMNGIISASEPNNFTAMPSNNKTQ